MIEPKIGPGYLKKNNFKPMAMSHQQRTTLKMLCEYPGRLEMTFWLIASIQKCRASKKKQKKKKRC